MELQSDKEYEYKLDLIDAIIKSSAFASLWNDEETEYLYSCSIRELERILSSLEDDDW